MGLGNLLLIPGLGAAPLDIRAKVGVSSSPTVTGNQAITGIGFQPKAVLPFGVGAVAVGNDTTLLHSFGAFTASQNASVGVRSTRNVTTSATARHHNSSNAVSYIDGALTGVNILASRQSLDADGFTLNYSALDGVSRILNHICLGGADLEVALTLQQMNNTNSAQSFAHGLSGSPTSLFIFSAHSDQTPPSTQSTAAISIGSWANGNQWCFNVWSNHGLTTTENRRTLTNTAVCRFNSGATHTIIRSMSVDSVDSSNVNVTYPVTTSSAQAYFYMLAIRGAKCQTGTFDCNGSTSPLTIPCSGITPKLFLPVFVPTGVDNINTVQSGLTMSIGASDGTDTVSCGISDSDTVTTTNARRWQSSTSFEEYTINSALNAFAAGCSFSGQSVVLTPTLNTSISFGQGAYLILGS